MCPTFRHHHRHRHHPQESWDGCWGGPKHFRSNNARRMFKLTEILTFEHIHENYLLEISRNKLIHTFELRKKDNRVNQSFVALQSSLAHVNTFGSDVQMCKGQCEWVCKSHNRSLNHNWSQTDETLTAFSLYSASLNSWMNSPSKSAWSSTISSRPTANLCR